MTTGQRLAKLRKDHKYTQEKLGEILEVTRQSISKWESDQAFPETQKLIELSKLYHCTVDYLLGNENSDNQISSADHKTMKKTFKMTPKLFTLIWGIGYFLVMLILYNVPILSTVVTTTPLFGNPVTMSIKINTYNLIAHGPSQIGNLLVYLCLFALIAILVLSICIYVTEKPIYYKARRITSIIEVIIWILFFGLFISHVQPGSLLILSTTIIHLISLFKMKNNQITTTINE